LQESQHALRIVAEGLLQMSSQGLPAKIFESLQIPPPSPPCLCICMPMEMMREIVELAAQRVPLESGIVSGFGFRVSGFGFWVSGFGFRVSGFGIRGSGLRVGV